MSRLFKSVVLCLSMLAIPVQGFAASTMLLCGLAGQDVKTAQVTEHQFVHSHFNTLLAEHRSHAPLTVVLDSVDLAASDQGGDFTNSDNGPGNTGEPGEVSCSACAACCTGTALMASDRKLQPAGLAIERMAPTPFRNIGFVTDGPKRPPRSFLA